MMYELLSEYAVPPVRGSEEAVGWDMTCVGISFLGSNLVKLHSNVAVATYNMSWFMLAARSSLYKKGLVPVNGVGIIDPDYRGPVDMVFQIIDEYLFNEFMIKSMKKGKLKSFRFAQLVKMPQLATFPMEGNLSETTRGTGGFGSTGE